MNKNILIGLVLIAAAAGGYYQFSVKPAQEAAAAAAEAAAAEAQVPSRCAIQMQNPLTSGAERLLIRWQQRCWSMKRCRGRR